MITDQPDEFLDAFARLTPSPDQRTTARGAFLIAPCGFSLAEESARDNAYMAMDQNVDSTLALAQHAELARAIGADLPVVTFPGHPDTPDAVFPNNVFGTAPGRWVVGRMRHPVRRREAQRNDIRQFFADWLGYREINLDHQEHLVCELTGSLVIDHARGIGFCGLGERCNRAGAEAMHAAFGLGLTFCFDLAAGEYHTNVVLTSLAGRGVIVAEDGFANPAAARAIATAYGDQATIRLSPAQKQDYAGNAITLSDQRVWMSRRAADSLTCAQRQQLDELDFAIGSVELAEIEKAGGSLRCCVGEIF